MSVTITIPAERLAGWHRRWVERITPGLLAKAAAGALQILVMRHLQKVARERHNTANRLGATPTGFWSGSAQAVSLHTHANDAEVSVTHPGIARALRDVIIRPRRAKALTIPLRAEAYGKRPREFANLSGADLFRPKGTRILATEEGGKLTPMYALCASVTQRRDPTLLPDQKTIDDALARAAINALETAASAAAR